MHIDDLTIGQAKALAAQFANITTDPAAENCACDHGPIPVVVCTDKRGVIFGYTTNEHARPIKVSDARMCLYWSTDVGGVFGLAEKGPTSGCKISATAPSLTLEGVTAVFGVEKSAERAWKSAPVQGR